MKVFTSKSQKIGEIGENIAVYWLLSKGFLIIERNHTKKWGEIDIIAKKVAKDNDENTFHFIEVKTVSRENGEGSDLYRPEDNLHIFKYRKMLRTAEIYMFDRDCCDWQLDLICVYIFNPNNNFKRNIKVKYIPNIVLN